MTVVVAMALLSSCGLLSGGAPEGSLAEPMDIAFGGGRHVAVGGPGDPRLYLSDDGEQWTATQPISNLPVRTVVWDGTRFLMAGDAGRIFWTTDGESIHLFGYSSQGAGPFRGAASCDGRLYVVGDQGWIMTSTDAYKWTRVGSIPETVDLVDVACSVSGIVLVPRNAGERYVGGSTNVFEPRGGTGSICAIEFAGSMFIEVSLSGAITTSSDLTTWTTRFDGKWSGVQSCDVAFGEGTFAVVTDTGVVLTSSDGADWTPFDYGATRTFSGVAFGPGGALIAVGRDGTVLEARCEGGMCTEPALRELTAVIPAESSSGGGSSSGGCVCNPGGEPCTSHADCGVDSSGIQNVCGCPG